MKVTFEGELSAVKAEMEDFLGKSTGKNDTAAGDRGDKKPARAKAKPKKEKEIDAALESATPSEEEVKTALNNYVKEWGAPALLELLGNHGLASPKELKTAPDKWAAVLADIDRSFE